jgi:hypothetical protein
MAVKLNDLEKPLPTVLLPGKNGGQGREVQIVPINGAVAQLRRDYIESKDELLLWKIVGELLPDATTEEVMKLTVVQCNAVAAIAAGNADDILAEIAEEAERKKKEGNPKATAERKPKARRRGTGSAS